MILHFPPKPLAVRRPQQIMEAYLAGTGDNEMLQRFGVTWREAVFNAIRTQEARIARLERESRMRRAA